ncbi:MAG TPA: hypothetical protein VGM03_17775 [Phycisphaerae bacterium]|jgi:hypothetical protein
MIVHPADRDIVKWAMDRSAPYYYTREQELPQPCLKVHCGHVTAYFFQGALVRVWAHADEPALEDMFVELGQLLALCEGNDPAPDEMQDFPHDSHRLRDN